MAGGFKEDHKVGSYCCGGAAARNYAQRRRGSGVALLVDCLSNVRNWQGEVAIDPRQGGSDGVHEESEVKVRRESTSLCCRPRKRVSQPQPDILNLSCGDIQLPWLARHPSRAKNHMLIASLKTEE